MRARICSAFSCDMFARVVWLRLRRAAKPPTFTLLFAAQTCHAWLTRLTRARGKSSRREGNALFDDFWYFWSYKSTIKKVSLSIFAGRRRRRPLSRRRRPRLLRESVNSRPTIELKPRNSQKKKHLPHPLFLLQKRAQKKKLSKRNPRYFYRGFLRGFILSWREPLPHISLLRQTSRSRRQDRSERNIRSTQPQREASLQPPA